MARPKKQEHEKATSRLAARCTKAELIHAKERAKAAGVDISDIIRRACLDEAVRPSQDANRVDATVISELNRIGNNLNQIARNLNSGRPDRIGVDVTIAELRSVLEQVASNYGS